MQRAVVAGSASFRGQGNTDSYLDKLVKYVPVEGLAPAVVLANGVGKSEPLLWATWAAALLVGMALTVVQVSDQSPGPRPWFWPFVVVAFGAWSLGAVDQFRDLAGLSAEEGQWSLGAIAFVLPAVDTALEKLWPSSS